MFALRTCPLVLLLLSPLVGCTRPGSGTVTYTFGPGGLEDVERLDFGRASFDGCPGCDWFAAAYPEDPSGSYFDGVGWDNSNEVLYRYTKPGSSLDGVGEGWLALLPRAELESSGYSWESTFDEEILEVSAGRASYWNNRCEDDREVWAVATREIDRPETGSITASLDCATEWAQHEVALNAGQAALFWVTTEQALTGPVMYVGYDGCNSGFGDSTVACNAQDAYGACPAVDWEIGMAHTATVTVGGFRRSCPEGSLTYTLHWAIDGASVGEATITDDHSPFVVPFTESHTVSFSLTEPGLAL